MADTITEGIISNLKDGALKSYLESFLPSVVSFFWSVVLALLCWVIGAKIIKAMNKIATKALNKKGAETGAIQFVNSLIRVLGYIVIIVIILNLFGVTSTSVAAALASLLMTAGLALQGSLANLAGGVLILVLHPFKVGDYIVEDTKGKIVLNASKSDIDIKYDRLEGGLEINSIHSTSRVALPYGAEYKAVVKGIKNQFIDAESDEKSENYIEINGLGSKVIMLK